jgi:predicted nucleotidyltransferase
MSTTTSNRKPARKPSLSDALFGKARRSVLALLYGNPDRTFYTREIVAYAETGASQVQKELALLSAVGLIERERRANQVYFQANQRAPIFRELRGIVLKTFGVAGVIDAALAPLRRRISIAAVYGSVARGEDQASSDVDLLIVGELALSDVVESLARAEARLSRSISPQIYSPEELAERVRKRQHFINRVLSQPMIFLIGTSDALQALAQRPAP